MQTFLPYTDFTKCAKVLDYRRLGKQRLEAKHILDLLLDRNNKKGWMSHPIVKLWRSYTDELKLYYNCMVYQWTERGFNNSMEFERAFNKKIVIPWLDEETCSMYRAVLLHKNPQWYSQFKWKEKPCETLDWDTILRKAGMS